MLCIAATLSFAGGRAQAAPENPNAAELRELRSAIEALTQQVARLTQVIEAKHGTATTEAVPAPSAPATEPAAPESAAKTEFAIPKAEAVSTEKHHVVVKGETLTSIAKAYGIPLGDLLKANKSVKAEKLQIGQSLAIPNTKTPEQPAEKKETP
jgi:LysM repeat protein